MKNTNATALLMIVITVMFFAFGSVGCSIDSDNFNVSGQENSASAPNGCINNVEDINNLVTSEEKLVINYYDAYIWVVYFSEDGSIDHMIYIYSFDTEETAASMVETRKSELSVNRSMTITSAKSLENYVVINLTDSSFASVTRDMLENNFYNLIVR